MGENGTWAEFSGLLPGAGPIRRALDSDRWLKAEARTSELIGCIQPNPLSEERRNAVAYHVQRLIMNCFPCEVCTFGSVPLKTYLPDGDIDLTAFSYDPNLKDTWANQVRDMLENEEKNENAEFHVKEVQYIQAEVKIIKCLVENIVVDISFNQVGGLCTLCFLDEVDNLINQDHLFKRSIILIKAWCYYESRILGAHHGLISTYALETLVLYIFHVFNNSFRGPLEVLYRFLEFFSNFDWDNFCVSLWGPVPINILPNVTAKPPRMDSEKLLLSESFLDACSSVYAVFPGGLENHGQPFVSKHFNVIDPLRVNNNLGRSVSKGNFYRIRSAFAFGAKILSRLLDCPDENVIFEVNRFFMNTWKRHGSGHRPDAPMIDSLRTRLSTPDNHHEYERYNNNISRINMKESDSVGIMSTTSELPAASHRQSIKSQSYVNNTSTNQTGRETTPDQMSLNDKFEKDVAADQLVYDSRGRFLARTRSSPELTDVYGDAPSQSRRHRQAETANAHASGRLDNSNRNNNNLGSESSVSHSRQSSAEDGPFMNHVISQRGLDAATADSNISSTSYRQNLGIDPSSEVSLSTAGSLVPHHDEQDIVNMMAATSLHGFNGSDHVPLNFNSAHLPFQLPPSFLHAMGYTQQNMPGFAPINTPLIDPSFPYGLVSPQLTHFPSIGVNSQAEDSYDREPDNFAGQGQDACSSPSYDSENGSFNVSQSGDKPPPPVSGWKYVSPHRQSGLVSSARVQQKHSKDKRGSSRQNSSSFPIQDTRSSEISAEERSTSSRFSSASRNNSLRSGTSSLKSSWDGSSVKTSKSLKEKRGKKTASELVNPSHGKGKHMSDQVSNQADDDQQWVSLQSVETEMIERNPGSDLVASLQVPGQTLHGYDSAQTSGSDSMGPFAPMFINPGSRQKANDNSGLIAFYPTGPPIPFLTMLPVYNIPPDSGNSDASSSHFGGDETSENYESEDHNQPSNSLRATTANETSDEKKSDILNSDFDSHYKNLLLGRSCQNPQYPSPSLYPSPMMVQPMYLQGRAPYDNPAALSANSNVFSQLMTNYGHHLAPLTPLQSVSARPSNVYQPYLDDMPRYRSGTGTYLPNPKITVRGRHSSGTRRGAYNHDRNDVYGDREGNWNANPKPRSGLRGYGRSQTARSNFRADRLPPNEVRSPRSWNAHRHDSGSSYPSQNGQMRSNFSESGPQDIPYNIYPSTSTESDGISNGPSIPPVMMLYPFDHNATTYGRHSEPLEFGSLGPLGFPGMDEQLHMNEGVRSRTYEENKSHVSSPDRPSSPHHYRRR